MTLPDKADERLSSAAADPGTACSDVIMHKQTELADYPC